MRILKSIAPPFLWSIGSRIKRRLVRSTTLLEYTPRGWSTPLPGDTSSEDFWTAFIAQERAYSEALVARIRAREPFLQVDGDESAKYAVFGYVLALATRHQSKISVLDYGGSLGDYYWLGRALVPGVDLEYHCKELPRVVEAGRLDHSRRDLAHRRCLFRPFVRPGDVLVQSSVPAGVAEHSAPRRAIRSRLLIALGCGHGAGRAGICGGPSLGRTDVPADPVESIGDHCDGRTDWCAPDS